MKRDEEPYAQGYQYRSGHNQKRAHLETSPFGHRSLPRPCHEILAASVCHSILLI